MATRTITTLISDLTGQEIAEGKGETVEFAYRGVTYSIDLSTKEAASFDKSIATYLEHGKRQGGRKRAARASSAGGGYNAREVRTWARDKGIEVPERGRIPAEVLEKYRAAQ